MASFLPPFWVAAVVIAFLLSIAGVGWIARDRWSAARRHLGDRFILGVPWGSVIVLGLVLAVYLFVQDGITNFHRPIVFPFVNWSYLYPLGVFVAPFAHGSANHLIGNMTTALVLAPLAEYLWGHYPQYRWGRVSGDRRLRDRPAVRAFLIVPAVLLGVAVLTSAFSWGPVIGFSGVVFALAGFTVVRYPIVTLLALLFRSGIREFGTTLFEPVVEASTSVSMSTPGWVGVAFQGHGFGFLVGAFIGIALLHYRDNTVDPVRVWLGLVLLMIATGLWAIWSSRGGDVYVLYRGLGFTLIFLAALLLTLTAVVGDRSIVGWLTRRRAALITLGLVIVLIAGVAVPFNLLVVSEYTPPEHRVDVAGYDAFYDEEVPNDLRPMLALDSAPSNASGLIVVDEDRQLWTEAVGKDELAFRGRTTIVIGGPFERAEVTANRTAWTPIGNDSVYRVHLEHGGTTYPTFASEASTANVTIAGHGIAIGADRVEGFYVSVTDPDGETTSAPFPGGNETRTIAGIDFRQESDHLVARYEDTRVLIARQNSG